VSGAVDVKPVTIDEVQPARRGIPGEPLLRRKVAGDTPGETDEDSDADDG
jgi:hypothetical protein